jgi:polyisoprenoid-binding protein YceI
MPTTSSNRLSIRAINRLPTTTKETPMTTNDTPSGQALEETIDGRWQLDPARSSVEFRTPGLWGLETVRGHFDEYRGRLDLSAEPAIDLTIAAASVETGNRQRDKYLRSAKFFDAENHPHVRFASDSVVLQGDTLRVRGRLAARGQSIALELDATLRRLDGEFTVEAATSALHRELGMTWSPLGMIRPRSELLVKGYLVPSADRDTGSPPAPKKPDGRGELLGRLRSGEWEPVASRANGEREAPSENEEGLWAS